jgi:hypothetical protein
MRLKLLGRDECCGVVDEVFTQFRLIDFIVPLLSSLYTRWQ